MIHKQPEIRRTESSDHEPYEQVCALASSGAFTPSEWKQLSEHLKNCASCRAELPKYQENANSGMALLAPNDVSLDIENEWSPATAAARTTRALPYDDPEEQAA